MGVVLWPVQDITYSIREQENGAHMGRAINSVSFSVNERAGKNKGDILDLALGKGA